jgi:hypothetical protein
MVEPQEQKGLMLYTLASTLEKQKARYNPCMVMYKFIGYFILVLHNFSSSQFYVTLSMFRFLRFYLSAMPSLPPCYFMRTQTYFVFYWSSYLLQYQWQQVFHRS